MMCAMLLYDRWRETADRYAAQFALRELDRVWTFRDLQNALEQLPVATGPVILRGNGLAFVLGTLQAWRDRQLAVPVEEGASLDLDQLQLDRLPTGIVHVKTTSGSTGAPRFVLFTADQLAADAAHIICTMGLRREWPNLGVISLGHSYGFSNLVLPLLLHGIPLILAPDPLPETMRCLLERCKAEGMTIPAVPAMWRTWDSAGVLGARRVRLGISAGAPLPVGLEKTIFESSGVKVHNFLGASECGGIAYDQTTVPRSPDSQWIGSALDAVSLSTTGAGALEVCSAAVGETYWPGPDSTLVERRFQSSDLVRLENNTEVHLLGRADDMINVSGRKVHPSEIELLLQAQPEVQHVVVFGVPSQNSLRGDDLVAIVNLQDGAALATVRRALAAKLTGAAWKLPRRWLIEPELQPDHRGKISRAGWKTRFLAEK